MVESYYFIGLTTFVTIWALFSDDIRQAAVTAQEDNVFYVLIMICFGVFVLEVILSSIAVNDYFLGFYFWLDIISTLTILLDVGWIQSALFGSGSGSSLLSGVQLAWAARASKIGSRAARIVRIIRLIRLIRVVKLYKAKEQIIHKEEEMRNHEDKSGHNVVGDHQKSGNNIH